MTDHAPTHAHREARLRAEHAHRYPGCPAGEWLPASIAAAYVLGHREVLLGPAQARAERALHPEEWEFRGESGFATTDRAQRRRFTDRHTVLFWHTGGAPALFAGSFSEWLTGP